jgi:hypothetical protein
MMSFTHAVRFVWQNGSRVMRFSLDKCVATPFTVPALTNGQHTAVTQTVPVVDDSWSHRPIKNNNRRLRSSWRQVGGIGSCQISFIWTSYRTWIEGDNWSSVIPGNASDPSHSTTLKFIRETFKQSLVWFQICWNKILRFQLARNRAVEEPSCCYDHDPHCSRVYMQHLQHLWRPSIADVIMVNFVGVVVSWLICWCVCSCLHVGRGSSYFSRSRVQRRCEGVASSFFVLRSLDHRSAPIFLPYPVNPVDETNVSHGFGWFIHSFELGEY